MASDTEYKSMNKLVSQYYNFNQLPNYNWEQVHALKLSLSTKKILKVNSIEDETLKIRKTDNGQGVELPPENSKGDKVIDMYSKYLNRLFIQINKKDLYIREKHKHYKMAE